MQSAIIATAYRLPIRRVSDWFEWNEQEICHAGAIVMLVVDTETAEILNSMAVPDHVKVIETAYKFTADSPFCLSWTSNLGIRSAIESGYGTIIKTDPDIWFGGSLPAMLDAIDDDHGVCPTYMMAETIDQARYYRERSTPWNQTRGMIGLSARTWEMIGGYDERMTGYGVEDGDAYLRASRHVGIARSWYVYHIAHFAGPQHRRARRDQWNRDDINPPLHVENRSICTPWEPFSGWGMQSGPAQ